MGKQRIIIEPMEDESEPSNVGALAVLVVFVLLVVVWWLGI